MKNSMKVLTLFLTATSIGCVSASKYKTLEDEKGTTDQQLAVCSKNKTDLEKKLGITSTEKDKLAGSVADMTKALQEAEIRKQESDKRLAEFQDLTNKFKKLVDAGKLSIKFQNGRMMIALSTDVLFSSGSAILSAEGKKAITEVAGLLKNLQKRNFQVEGHTDNIPMKSAQFPSNWELASARSISVLNTMLAAGVQQERLSAASYGAAQPIADNTTDTGRQVNRRIAIVVVPDLSGLPGFDELKRLSENDI